MQALFDHKLSPDDFGACALDFSGNGGARSGGKCGSGGKVDPSLEPIRDDPATKLFSDCGSKPVARL
jgi:hypothetical protein